jgi:hypothetical protein
MWLGQSTCMLLRHLIIKRNCWKARLSPVCVQASSVMPVKRTACRHPQLCLWNAQFTTEWNSCLLCRIFLSHQGSTLLKMQRMTFVSRQQAGAMIQPKSWRRQHHYLIAGSVGQLQENETVLKVEYIKVLSRTCWKQASQVKNQKNQQPAEEEKI